MENFKKLEISSFLKLPTSYLDHVRVDRDGQRASLAQLASEADDHVIAQIGVDDPARPFVGSVGCTLVAFPAALRRSLTPSGWPD